MMPMTQRELVEHTKWYDDAIEAAKRAFGRVRAYMGSNGLWYAAISDDRGFHCQGVGTHESAQAATGAWKRDQLECLYGLRCERELAAAAQEGRRPDPNRMPQAVNEALLFVE